MSDVARATGATMRTILMPSLGREIVASMVEGAVVVVVSSRKDASIALSLGADEIVRVAQSVTLRKSTIESAIARARTRSGARTATPFAAPPAEICPTLTILMRALEPRFGRPFDTATTACAELAGELTRVVAIADGFVQRVQLGVERDDLKSWFGEVKDYAEATLRVEALSSALRQEVQRGDAVLKWLGNLFDSASRDADAASSLQRLAELVGRDLPPHIVCEFTREAACAVGVPRATLISLVCEALSIALENLAGSVSGRVTLKTAATEGEAVIEVADDGAPGPIDLRPTVLDLVLADGRTARLRALREQARRAGGELFVDADEGGNVISIYLPSLPELALVGTQREATTPHLQG
jgi:hypothetical protein